MTESHAARVVRRLLAERLALLEESCTPHHEDEIAQALALAVRTVDRHWETAMRAIVEDLRAVAAELVSARQTSAASDVRAAYSVAYTKLASVLPEWLPPPTPL